MGNAFLEHHESWKAQHSENSYGFTMLKVPVGTIQFRVLDQTPTSRILHFNSVGNRPVICPGEGCVFCDRGDERSTQHYLNIVDRADDKVKVLVYSAAAADEFARLIQLIAKSSNSAKFNHPTKYDIRLVRTGTGRKNTRYDATAIKKDFSPDAYTVFDLNSKLVPMSVEEQKTKQGKRDTPSADISSRELPSWEGNPPSTAITTSEVKTVIEDDDKEL